MFSAGAICCFGVLVIVLQTSGTNGNNDKDFYTSVAGLEKLMSTEAFLMTHLQSYVQSMSSQLDMLKREIEEINHEHKSAALDPDEYLTNPVNAYLLIKRLEKDWTIYENTINNEVARNSFLDALKFSRENMSFPTDQDTSGSVAGLIRIQETYQLETSQVAAGILNGVKYGSPMSWQDCFQLGQQLFNMKDYNHTKQWLKESYQKLQSEEYFNSSETVAFLQMVIGYHVHMGDFETALDLNNKVLEIDPDTENALEYNKYLELMMKFGHKEPVEEKKENLFPYRQTHEFKAYEKVCRGEIKQSPSEERELRCSYTHRNAPYRFLMPFKMEEMNKDPYVVVFYDVIDDSEIEPIKEFSRNSMRRSQVRGKDGDVSTTSLYRTSQNTWIKYHMLPETLRLQERLGDVTGLDMNAIEELQVANYGIGGHYEPHFDFFDNDPSLNDENGDRIATAIFYFTDIEHGGATSFPFLKRAVRPKKGSVLFWYNLHRDQDKDFRTKHAACPVLKGSKWVANVWIRNHNQMFARPCGLQPDHAISLPYRAIR